MKRMTAFAMIAAILLPCVKAAEVTENMNFRGQVNFDAPCIWSIQGTKVTQTAAQLNAAGGGTTATITPTTVSNLNANIVGSNLVITTGGTVTVPADAISIDAVNGITVSAAAINAAGNGTTATLTPTTVSNLNANIVGSNLVITTGGTVTVPADAISIDAVNGITVTAAAINAAGAGTTATISPTTATVGTTLTASKTFINTPETITLTQGNFTLTPTNAVYCFDGQYGVSTVTLANASSSGMYLELINLGATNVVVIDGDANLTTLPAGYTAWTNGQYDGMKFRSVSTNWINTGTFASE
jgi:hypothetical protein